MARQMLRPDNRHECETPKEANISGRTHALLPAFCLLNRLDAAGAIGAVIEAVADGRSGVRPAALSVGVPHTTARGWVRAFAKNAGRLQAALGALAVELAGDVVPVGADHRDRRSALLQ